MEFFNVNWFLYYNSFSALYEYELMAVILEVFGGIAQDSDPCVRQAVCQFIIVVCNNCDSVHHAKLLQILAQVCVLHHF